MIFASDRYILKLFDGPGRAGWTTRQITEKIRGNVNLRKHSAIMYRELSRLATLGYLKEMDDRKPILWAITAKGLAAQKERGQPDASPAR